MELASPLDRDSHVYVAGHRGLVGGAIWRHLQAEGFTNLVGQTSKELDLRDREPTFKFFADQKPDVVFMAAARVGGILANKQQPTEFLSENLRIQLNILEASHQHGVRRLLFLGSSCIYPKFADQPIKEDSLLTGPLEPTNEAYAIAKIAGVIHVQALRRQYGLRYISAMPTNLYGPGDNFDLASSHVLPALMRRFHEASMSGAPNVTNWGTGTPEREFLHVDDLAKACLFLVENYDDDRPMNVGTGEAVRIRVLSQLIAEVIGYQGAVRWDDKKPDGTPRKLLDLSRIHRLGWRADIGLREGLESTYSWYLENCAPPT